MPGLLVHLGGGGPMSDLDALCPLGGPRCTEDICDCFIDTHPEDPLGLHPEQFIVSQGEDDDD